MLVGVIRGIVMHNAYTTNVESYVRILGYLLVSTYFSERVVRYVRMISNAFFLCT